MYSNFHPVAANIRQVQLSQSHVSGGFEVGATRFAWIKYPSETFTFQEKHINSCCSPQKTEVVKDVRECVLTNNVAEPVKPIRVLWSLDVGCKSRSFEPNGDFCSVWRKYMLTIFTTIPTIPIMAKN